MGQRDKASSESDGQKDMIIRTFCICLSIRLGSLLIGIAYLSESALVLILSAVWFGSDPEVTRQMIVDKTAEYHLLYVGKVINRISHDPSPFRELALSISCGRLLCCIFVIYGTYYMKPFYLVPFLLVELIRLGFLMFLHITAMQILKENSQDLGLLITCTLAGSFLLCFMLYCWICVYSLYKVVRRVQKLEVKTMLPSRPQLAQSNKQYPSHFHPAYFRTYTSPIAPVY